MYIIVNFSQKQPLVFNSHLTGNNSSVFPKKHDKNIFSEKYSMN